MRRFIYIILMLVVTACGHDMELRLRHIQSCIDTDSVTAYRELMDIDSALLGNDANRALYDLLMTEKIVKNDQPIGPADIARARNSVSYYAKNKLSTDRADACHYLGRLLHQAHEYRDNLVVAVDFPGALKAALDGLSDAEALRDTFRIAKSHALIGDIYVYSYLVGSELPHRRAAKELFAKYHGNDLFYAYAVIDLADCYTHLEMYDDCIAMLDSNAACFDTMPDVTRIHYQTLYTIPYINTGQLEKAKAQLLHIYNSPDSIHLNVFAYENLLKIYSRQDSLDKVQYWHSLLEQRFAQNTQGYILMDIRSQTLKTLGKYAEAFPLVDSMYKVNKELTWRLARNGMQNAVQEYYAEKKEKDHLQYVGMRRNLIIGILLLIAITIAVVIFFRRRLTERRIAVERTIDEIKSLHDELQTVRIKARTDSARARLLNLSSGGFDSINKICVHYLRRKDDGKVPDPNLTIERQMRQMRNSNNLAQLEQEINVLYDNLLAEFRSEFPDTNTENFNLLIYSIIGFPSRIISFILDIDRKNFYTRRSRLKQKIKESEWSRKDEILQYLSHTDPA